MKFLFRSKRGSLTVEAALVLPIFICVIMTFALLIKVAYVHSIIQHAITETAHEIASNSYVYYASGIADLQKSIDEGLEYNAMSAVDDLNQLTEAYGNILSNAASAEIAGLTGINQIKDNLQEGNIVAAIQEIRAVLSNIDGLMEATTGEGQRFIAIIDAVIEDPQSKLVAGGSLVGQQLFDYIKTALGNAIAKSLMKKHLLILEGQSIDARLKQLNIKEMDFSKSRYFIKENDTDDIIDIVVTYKLDIPLPIKFISEINIVQRSTVKAWMAGKNPPILYEKSGLKVQKEIVDEVVTVDYDIWAIEPNFRRGEAINSLLGDAKLFGFKLIDKIEDAKIVSLVSCRTTDASYGGDGISRKLKGDVDEIFDFVEASGIIDGTEASIKPKLSSADVNGQGRYFYEFKKLNVAIPDVELSEEQLQSIKSAKDYAKEKNIEIIITVIKTKGN